MHTQVMSDPFRAARDFLLAYRTDYDVACRGFQWPRLDRFNWALDWFDSIGAGERRDQPALWIVFEDGTETKLSFRELSSRSSQIANYYRELGIRRGDRVMVMLGNVFPLWNTVLALIKLGAVILPTTPLLSRNDLADRIERGACGTSYVPQIAYRGLTSWENIAPALLSVARYPIGMGMKMGTALRRSLSQTGKQGLAIRCSCPSRRVRRRSPSS